MKIKALLSGVMFAGLIVNDPAQALMITVEFDVNITSKIDSGYQSVPFEPLLHQYASITFDNTLTSTSRYTSNENIIMQHVVNGFGEDNQTVIVSPLEHLTNVNPLVGAPVATSSAMESRLWYSLAPPDYSQVSFAHEVGVGSYSSSETHKYPNSYEGESWYRWVGIYSSEYLGAFDQAALENYTYTSEMLMSHFIKMRDTGGAFYFSDGYSYSNRPSLLASGYHWLGVASITNIIVSPTTPVPEPATMILFGVGIAGLIGARLKKRKQ